MCVDPISISLSAQTFRLNNRPLVDTLAPIHRYFEGKCPSSAPFSDCLWQELLHYCPFVHNVSLQRRSNRFYHTAEVSLNIDMQHSRSLGSFTALITPEESLVARPRARSSLDTFVIPGRTRIPSHKPHPIDFEIAQNLLNFTMTRTIRPTPDGEQNLKFESPSDRLQKPPTSPETSQEITLEPDVAPQRNPHEVKATPRQRKQTLYPLKREIMIIPQRHQRRRSLVAKVEHENEPPQKAEQADGYDGAFGSGSGYDSRVTSMSWSTISQRVMSSSSGSSPSGPGPLEALEHYNRLASRQGLLEMERCPGGMY